MRLIEVAALGTRNTVRELEREHFAALVEHKILTEYERHLVDFSPKIEVFLIEPDEDGRDDPVSTTLEWLLPPMTGNQWLEHGLFGPWHVYAFDKCEQHQVAVVDPDERYRQVNLKDGRNKMTVP